MRYRGLVESQSDLVVRVDPEGKFTYVNDAYCKMFGKKREELIGNNFTPLVHEEDLPHTLKKMEELNYPPFRMSVEQRALTAQDWRWLSWEDYAIKDDQGNTTEIQAIGRDIHNQRLVELELQREHDFVMQVINHMGQGLVVLKQDYTIGFANPAFIKLVDFSTEDLEGISIRKFVSKEDWKKIEALNEEIGQNHNVVKEVKLVCANGDGVYAMLSAVPIKLREAPEGMVIVVTDLTQRNLIEVERRKNDNFLRSVYDITSSQEILPSEKIQQLLQLGCQEFEMETGIFAKVYGEISVVLDYYTTNVDCLPGSTFVLNETYSKEAVLANAPIAIEHASKSKWAKHACYKKYRVESYIGVPVIVSGKLFGYLSFSSMSPRIRKFRSVKKEILRLIAQWVGNEIAQQEYLEQLKVSATEIAIKNRDLAEARDQALEASRLKSEFLATMSS